MPAKQEVSSFIRSTFRSVWAIELLCFLRKNPERGWTQAEMISALRGSELVVAQSVESLFAAGLLMVEPGGIARYQPVSHSVDTLAGAAEALYAQRPDAVRRMIVTGVPSGAASFADAFKLWRD